MKKFLFGLPVLTLCIVCSCTKYEKYGALNSYRNPEYVSETIIYNSQDQPEYKYYIARFDWISYNYGNADANLDEEKWEMDRKRSTLFDEYGNPIAAFYQYPYDNESGEFSYQICYEVFDANNGAREYHIYRWLEEEQRWNKYQILMAENDSQDRLSLLTIYRVEQYSEYEEDVFEMESKHYTYTNDGLIREITTSIWDGNTWQNYRKEEFEYNGNEDVILEAWYYYEDGDWLKDDKREYTYLDDSHYSQVIYYRGASDGNTWIQDYKSDYTYTSGDLITHSMHYRWDNLTSNWENATKTEYDYDHPLFPKVSIGYEWNDIYSQWQDYNKSEWELDGEDHYIVVHYDYVNGHYEFIDKLKYTVLYRED